MKPYTEFVLIITAYDLAIVDDFGENSSDSEELLKLFKILGITPLRSSLLEKYESFDNGKLYGRFGRGNVIVLLSDLDTQTFISIDMFLDITDQMCSVEFGVSCPSDRSEEVVKLLQELHSVSEISGYFRSGVLGLSQELKPDNFPRVPKQVSYRYSIPITQDLEVYRYGILQKV